MKTIDGDALIQALEKEKTDTLDGIVCFGIAKCIDIVRNAPAIEERQQGKWINRQDAVCYMCSACGKYTNQEYGLHSPNFFEYCPRCSAEMEKGDTGSEADYQELMANIKPKDCEHCAHCIPAGYVSFCELPECNFEALGGDENERLSGNS